MRLNSGRWKVGRGYEMRPRRYPYRGEKESTFVKADPELVEKLLRNTSFLERLQKKAYQFTDRLRKIQAS